MQVNIMHYTHHKLVGEGKKKKRERKINERRVKILAGILGSTDVQRVHVKVTSTNYSLCYLQYSYNRQLHTHSTPGFKVKIAPTIHTLPLQFNTVAYHAMSDWQIIPEVRWKICC